MGDSGELQPGFSATTGQVASEEPRPISTSRQPVLPRSVTSMPFSRISIQPRPSSVWSRPTVEADDLGAAQTAGEAEQQHGAVAQAAQRAAVKRLQHGDQIFGQDRFLLPGRGGVRVADAGHHRGDMAVLAIERQPALGIVPGQATTAAARSSRRSSASCRRSAVPDAQAVM